MDAIEAMSVQIAAMASGSLVASATARKAAIGATICARIATNTIGIRTSSRRRTVSLTSVPRLLTPMPQRVEPCTPCLSGVSQQPGNTLAPLRIDFGGCLEEIVMRRRSVGAAARYFLFFQLGNGTLDRAWCPTSRQPWRFHPGRHRA